MRVLRLSHGVLWCLLAAAAPARAELIDLRNGMVYDTVQNLTWMQDPLLAVSRGDHTDGRMTYAEAVAWAGDLVYAGFDDWRLPRLFDRGIWSASNSEISTAVRQLGWHWDGIDFIHETAATPFLDAIRGRTYWVEPTLDSGRVGGHEWWSTFFEIDHADGRQLAGAWVVREGNPYARVPEPSTLLLVGLGITAAALRRRVRRSASRA